MLSAKAGEKLAAAILVIAPVLLACAGVWQVLAGLVVLAGASGVFFIVAKRPLEYIDRRLRAWKRSGN